MRNFVLILFISLLFSSCASQKISKPSYIPNNILRLAIISEHTFSISDKDIMMRAQETTDILGNIEIEYHENFSVHDNIQNLKEYLTKGVEGIILVTEDLNPYHEILSEARQQGTLIIVCGVHRFNPSEYDVHIQLAKVTEIIKDLLSLVREKRGDKLTDLALIFKDKDAPLSTEYLSALYYELGYYQNINIKKIYSLKENNTLSFDFFKQLRGIDKDKFDYVLIFDHNLFNSYQNTFRLYSNSSMVDFSGIQALDDSTERLFNNSSVVIGNNEVLYTAILVAYNLYYKINSLKPLEDFKLGFIGHRILDNERRFSLFPHKLRHS